MEDEIFERIDFSLDIRRLNNGKLVEITPCIEIDAEKPATLIVSFRIDGMELIESARVVIAPGRNRVPLREKARIGNPNLWHIHTSGRPSLYEMSLIFHKNGQAYYLINKIVGIRFPEWTDGKKLILNGIESQFRRYEFTAVPEENELEKLCRAEGFNFTMLRDTQNALEEILTLCDRIGIAAALELSGNVSPSILELHPSVCLFHAAKESAGHQLLREHVPAVPFLPTEELAGLLRQCYSERA